MAFTLVELSIVLVIIGLLVGSVMGGQSLVRASEMRSINTQTTNINTAINVFKDKYFNIPGEFLEYQSVWPQLVGNSCNKPGFNGNTPDGIFTNNYDTEGAYAQLQAAGLVSMGRPQILSDGTVRAFWDCPNNGMLQMAAFNTKFSVYAYLSSQSGTNELIFGSHSEPMLKVEEALAFDLKFDDGKPQTGNIRGRRTTVPTCNLTDTTGDTTSTYWINSANAQACYMEMLLK